MPDVFGGVPKIGPKLQTNELVGKVVGVYRDQTFLNDEILTDLVPFMHFQFYMPKNLLEAKRVYWYLRMLWDENIDLENRYIESISVITDQDVGGYKNNLEGAPFLSDKGVTEIGPIRIDDLSNFNEFKTISISVNFPEVLALTSVGTLILSKCDVLYYTKIGTKV